MSHFPVAVISDGTKTIEELMLPYMENCCSTPPKEYMTFFDKEEESLEQYLNETIEVAKMPDGRLLFEWDDEFRKAGQFGYGKGTHEVPAEIPIVKVSFKEKYEIFEEFMADWHGMKERDSEMGRYGYWQNPNAKWDWYVIGGRWRGALRASEGTMGEPSWSNDKEVQAGRFDSAKIKHIDFSEDREAYNRAIAEWEYNIEGKGDNEDLQWWKSADYILNRYKNKETYAQIMATPHWHAVITPDGKWHEVGTMGWWGISSETDDELVDWALHFKERFIDPYDPECTLTIVDCHI